jgi:cytochrome b subunit of formate dehydrogenase/nitrate reductase cytochrome c-type subunit
MLARAYKFAFLVILALASRAPAYDTEGCLNCHQYRGLARISEDKKNIDLFYVDPNYYSMALGPHGRLKCTDCHVRGEVAVFPHLTQTPVDCGKVCHLTGPNQVEVRFSHKNVDALLGQSVHGAKDLAECNQLLGSPLKTGQSQCLLCHDEPTYNRGQTWVQAVSPISRCNTCHEGQLAIDTRQFYFHVASRAHPARTNEDQVRLCATCHSNAEIQAKFNLPDTTVSYLASFHGKSTMLGSDEAANCLDCHVGQTRDAHQILAHTNPAAPTNAANLPDTCRAPACHRAAGAQISSAAVHLDLSRSRGVEYFIACLFVFLIVFTFGPSLLLTALKMLEIVVGRQDPHEHHNIQLARKLLADEKSHAALVRFNVHQRFQHWVLASCFVTLVLTGFPLKFADRAWAAWLIGEFGGISWARSIHHYAGAVLILGLLYHGLYIVRTIRRQRKTTRAGWIKILFGLPMMIGPADLLQMNGLMLYLLGLRKTRPAGGRFNAEEKFEYVGVFWGVVVLGTTGTLMWFNAWTTQHLPGRILTIAILIHTMEAFLALLHVGIVHMVGVILSPDVFPVSPAMFTGETPIGELAEAHTAMLQTPTTAGEAAHA